LPSSVFGLFLAHSSMCSFLNGFGMHDKNHSIFLKTTDSAKLRHQQSLLVETCDFKATSAPMSVTVHFHYGAVIDSLGISG